MKKRPRRGKEGGSSGTLSFESNLGINVRHTLLVNQSKGGKGEGIYKNRRRVFEATYRAAGGNRISRKLGSATEDWKKHGGEELRR